MYDRRQSGQLLDTIIVTIKEENKGLCHRNLNLVLAVNTYENKIFV